MQPGLATLRNVLLAEATNAFRQSIDELNATDLGTVYAVMAHCGDGLVSVGLTANTLEHLATARTSSPNRSSDDPYWEVHCAEFVHVANWEPFSGVAGLLDSFYNGYYDGEFDLPDDQDPVGFVGDIVIEAFAEADVTATVSTTVDPILVGLGFSDPHGDATHELIVRASSRLNTADWHAKVASVFATT